MFFGFRDLTKEYIKIIEEGTKTAISDKELLSKEIKKWKTSKKRLEQITGEKYYMGFHEILKRNRTAIGENGELVNINNLPNNKIVDNQYQKIVDQKVNFLLGQPITFQTDDEIYAKLLQDIFDYKFHKIFKALCTDCLNGGIGWLYPYYDEKGNFCFKRFAPYEILPFWKDSEHEELDFAVRLYEVSIYEGQNEKIIEKVEVYTNKGIERYVLENGVLILDIENPSSDYLTLNNTNYNWSKIPLVSFKYNFLEIPLIRNTKTLQDSINSIISDFQNNMQEDSRNTILIIKNYDGENLGEFRRNLASYGAIKTREDGDVEALKIEINSENYKTIIELLKKEIISVAKAYDANELRFGNTPNEMNIKSVFNDINMDANSMELEFQASLKELLWFINMHFINTKLGNFENKEVKIIFNKDTIVNESQVIEDIKNSVGIISDETLIENHPYTQNPKDEIKKIQRQKEREILDYINVPPERAPDTL